MKCRHIVQFTYAGYKKKIINNFQTSCREIKIYSRIYDIRDIKFQERYYRNYSRFRPPANQIGGRVIENVTSIATCFVECIGVRVKIVPVFTHMHMFTRTVGVADCATTDFAITIYLLFRKIKATYTEKT